MKKKNKIFGLNDWILDENDLDPKRKAQIVIDLKWPDIYSLIHLKPRERQKEIDHQFTLNLQRLLKGYKFDKVECLGSKIRPRGIRAEIHFSDLKTVEKFAEVEFIWIKKIDGTKKIVKKKSPSFFCIRMTVAIQIEGISKGLQSYEERFVLIKAKSSDDAYKKMEVQKKKNPEPYLNPNGELVRWKIESLDDCYETYIDSVEEFNNSEGVEVYSILKNRRITPERFWDGETN